MIPLFLACVASTPPAALPDVPTPGWTRAEVESRLAAALAGDFPSFPLLQNTYEDLMRHGDGVCPPSTSGFELLAGCDATTGYTYRGAGGGFSSWTDGVYSFNLRADMEIQDPAGAAFEVGCDVKSEVAPDGDDLVLTEQFIGSMAYPPAGGWLGPGTSAAAWLEADFPAVGPPVVHVDGGYQLGADAVYFDDLRLDGCPRGGLGLRDPSGHWYTLGYDEACGCGELRFAETDLGRACVDPAPTFVALGARLRDHLVGR